MVEKTKEVNINTPDYWNTKLFTHGGGERNDDERLQPIALRTFGVACDVGCMFGHLCDRMLGRCDEVYGVDLSRVAIAKAKRNYPACSFLVASAEHLPFRDKVFDFVTSAETLEHLTDWKKGLAEMCRTANNVIFSVPNESIYDEHVWTFSVKDVENIVAGRGYCKMLTTKWIMGVMKVD